MSGYLCWLSLQNWTEELMHLAYSSNLLNGSSTTFLQKAHIRLCVQVDKSGKIPVKKYVRNNNQLLVLLQFNLF